MPKKFVNSKNPEAGPAYPTDAADEKTLRELGWFEEGYPKQMYRDGEEPREVISSEEEKALGEGWVVFDEALRKFGGFYHKRFEAAVNNPAEQVRILVEYYTLHPALVAADSWYKKTAQQIPVLQTQAMFNIVSDRQPEDRERRATEAEATEAAVIAGEKLPKTVREGKRCFGVIDEVKRIKNMYASGGMSMKEIREAQPNYEVWRIVEQLTEQDRAVFETPLRWGQPVGYAKLILGKLYGKSPATVNEWVKSYRKHERSEKPKD
jgi:hypothetical protein